MTDKKEIEGNGDNPNGGANGEALNSAELPAHSSPPGGSEKIHTGLEHAEMRGEEPEFDLTYPPGQVSDEEFEARQRYWLKNVYQGDDVPQLTVRAILMGGTLGALMSISNLYTTLKVGWSFGVAITACVLSFVIWRGFRVLIPKLSPMTLLENNCMQSAASAAGYSTGATIGTAFGALLLIQGVHIGWQTVLPWTLVSAALGVFLAIPMKRQMINREQLAFPSGIAAAETLRSLYAQSKEAVTQAYSLVIALAVGAFTGFLGRGEYAWQIAMKLKLPELIPFSGQIRGVDVSKMPAFGFEPSALLIGAGMIVGMRVSLSMLVGALALYLYFGPWMVSIGQIPEPSKLLRSWALWPGTALLVTSGLTAFALQWKTIVKAFSSAKTASSSTGAVADEALARVEVPGRWLIIGLIPLSIIMIALQYIAFSISIPLGLLAVVMSFFLSLVACRATGETDITPIGPMGKITQLTYAVLAPSNITTNLMAASVTANIASSSADLLIDLKSGYLLGANARKQFLAQFIGVFFGSLAIVPAWYLMVPNKAALEKFNPPAANMWKAVAEALVNGINYLPETARIGLLVGGALGIVLAMMEHFAPPHVKKWLPSSMGLGLSWVVPFANSFSFFIGALVALIWTKVNNRTAELYVIPIASGAVAGESLMCAVIAMITAAQALGAR
ncbi:MAG: OPT family oligopeptide transporter [Candidatus Melainabacteria bacterium]|nr:OPT family oligopeptide transporter [Candidatus Melainabacteria bacterium]